MLNIRLVPSPSLNYTKTRKHQKLGRVHTNATTDVGPMPVIMLHLSAQSQTQRKHS